MAELGFNDDDTSAMSPAASAPDETMNQRRGMNGFRRASRFFWPGNHHHRRPGSADTMDVPMGHRNNVSDDEYDQELVDWLDVIGKQHHNIPAISHLT
jgi:hypothetical protein